MGIDLSVLQGDQVKGQINSPSGYSIPVEN